MLFISIVTKTLKYWFIKQNKNLVITWKTCRGVLGTLKLIKSQVFVRAKNIGRKLTFNRLKIYHLI